MNVCFFGIYDPTYSRSRVLMAGFRHNGYVVTECNIDPTKFSGISKYLALYRTYKSMRHISFKYVVVGFPGQSVVWLARFLFGKHIIFDAFLSLYDSNVYDREVYSKWSFRALRDWFLDWYSCAISETVLLDTLEHIHYFEETFKIKRRKFIRVWIGADESIFYPQDQKQKHAYFLVHFHGMFIPLQGVRYIIDAAEILRNENIVFQLVGRGQHFKEIEARVKKSNLEDSIRLVGRVPPSAVPSYIAEADLCLGIFGNTPKTNRVIPNKLYECIAMRKAIITGETVAVKELFKDREHMLFCSLADGKDLAEKILLLRQDNSLREYLAKGGYEIFRKELNSRTLISELLTTLSNKYAKK